MVSDGVETWQENWGLGEENYVVEGVQGIGSCVSYCKALRLSSQLQEESQRHTLNAYKDPSNHRVKKGTK